jgi:hypothetical protein
MRQVVAFLVVALLAARASQWVINRVLPPLPRCTSWSTRFAFCKRPEVLRDALARIEKWALYR